MGSNLQHSLAVPLYVAGFFVMTATQHAYAAPQIVNYTVNRTSESWLTGVYKDNLVVLTTEACSFDIEYLVPGRDYQFVQNGGDSSSIYSPGTVSVGLLLEEQNVVCGQVVSCTYTWDPSPCYFYGAGAALSNSIPVLDASLSDFDQDSVVDSSDNCMTVANKNQLDTDQNGIGDACELKTDINPSVPVSSWNSNDKTLGPQFEKLGDFNGDGSTDFITGDPDSKTIKVYSGENGEQLYTLTRASDYAYPIAIGGAGDINNDGLDDFFHQGETNSSQDFFQIRSGLSPHGNIHSFLGPAYDQFLGSANINGDNYPDMLVLDEVARDISIYSGSDKTLISVLDKSYTDFDKTLFSMAGNTNNDGVDDFIIAEPEADTARGVVRIYSGDFTELLAVSGVHVNDRLGSSVDSGFDINGDGNNDFIVGAQGVNYFKGQVTVYSGINGDVIYQYTGDSWLRNIGSSVSMLGDVNGDAVPDFMFSVNETWQSGTSGSKNVKDPKEYQLFSGSDGSLLLVLRTDDFYPIEIKPAGDINNDGYADLASIKRRGSDDIVGVTFYSLAPAYLDDDGDGFANPDDDYPLDGNLAGDKDGDKVDEAIDNCRYLSNYVQSDNDNDGLGNACDPDIDGDNVDNFTDNFPLNPLLYTTDIDNDIVDDAVDNCPTISNYLQHDNDNDGIGNACDDDLDGDGEPNTTDQFPLNPNLWLDADGDQVNDPSDNCPTISNYKQHDNDNDGIGNACDDDWDGDGVDNDTDNYPWNPALT